MVKEITIDVTINTIPSGKLSVRWNRPLKDIELLQNSQVERFDCSGIHMTDNDFASLSDQPFISKIKMLNCSENELVNMPGLDRFKGLICLDCSKNKIDNLPRMPRSLRMLNAEKNRLSSIKGLQRCIFLESLALAFNRGTKAINLHSLSKLTEIRALNLSHCRINHDSLSAVRKLVQLEVFEGTNLGLFNIEFLENCHSLQEVHLTYNKIDNLNPLKIMERLENLLVGYNHIRSLDGLEKCLDLKTLVICNNPIVSITELEYMLKLEILDVSGTRINKKPILPGIKCIVHSLPDDNDEMAICVQNYQFTLSSQTFIVNDHEQTMKQIDEQLDEHIDEHIDEQSSDQNEEQSEHLNEHLDEQSDMQTSDQNEEKIDETLEGQLGLWYDTNNVPFESNDIDIGWPLDPEGFIYAAIGVIYLLVYELTKDPGTILSSLGLAFLIRYYDLSDSVKIYAAIPLVSWMTMHLLMTYVGLFL
jgi:hypothetical protein